MEVSKFTSVPPEDIQSVFSGTIDLISAALQARILCCSDEWFAPATNLLTPTPPIRRQGVYTHTGAWYDGWETRRHNPAAFDWVVIRLGAFSGTIKGIEIDTAFFDGNHAPEVVVQGVYHPPVEGHMKESGEVCEDPVNEWANKGEDCGYWKTILPQQPCCPSRRHAWLLPPSTEPYTHVRLLMFPDGGIARFRLYGNVVPPPSALFSSPTEDPIDLAGVQNGGLVMACSNEHFGSAQNLLLPGRGVDMRDGWETKRSRGQDHIDWAIIRLGMPASDLGCFVVDTKDFRGNFPRCVRIEALDDEDSHENSGRRSSAQPAHDDPRWRNVLPKDLICGPDQEHRLGGDKLRSDILLRATHVKLVMIPDGGIKRFRVFGWP